MAVRIERSREQSAERKAGSREPPVDAARDGSGSREPPRHQRFCAPGETRCTVSRTTGPTPGRAGTSVHVNSQPNAEPVHVNRPSTPPAMDRVHVNRPATRDNGRSSRLQASRSSGIPELCAPGRNACTIGYTIAPHRSHPHRISVHVNSQPNAQPVHVNRPSTPPAMDRVHVNRPATRDSAHRGESLHHQPHDCPHAWPVRIERSREQSAQRTAGSRERADHQDTGATAHSARNDRSGRLVGVLADPGVHRDSGRHRRVDGAGRTVLRDRADDVGRSCAAADNPGPSWPNSNSAERGSSVLSSGTAPGRLSIATTARSASRHQATNAATLS